MHALPTRREAHVEALHDQELNRAYRDYLATDPEDVRGRALARLCVERAVQERYPFVSTKTPVIIGSGMAPAVWNPPGSDARSILDILVPIGAAIVVLLLVALCVSLFP
jgi:hypothetical protein